MTLKEPDVEELKNFSAFVLKLLKDATESRRKCEMMKEQETQLKQQVSPIQGMTHKC